MYADRDARILSQIFVYSCQYGTKINHYGEKLATSCPDGDRNCSRRCWGTNDRILSPAASFSKISADLGSSGSVSAGSSAIKVPDIFQCGHGEYNMASFFPISFSSLSPPLIPGDGAETGGDGAGVADTEELLRISIRASACCFVADS